MATVFQDDQLKSALSQILSKNCFASVVVVAGKNSFHESGASECLKELLADDGTHLISGISPNPALSELEAAARAINERKAELVIGIGGGSVLDLAKAAALFYKSESIADCIQGKKALPEKELKTLMIPTTAGTGSEITPFSVITISGIKTPFADAKLIPDYVILDPALTYSLPKSVTAMTGVDALAQAIEAYWSVSANEEAISHSKKAIELILPNLSGAVSEPNLENRKAMLLGAFYSGKAIAIAKTTAAHAISYPLTLPHGIPHGHAVMLVLPHLFEGIATADETNIQTGLTAEIVKERFKALLELLGVNSYDEARKMLLRLLSELGLETRLSPLGIEPSDLQEIAEKGNNPARIANHPVRLSTADVYQLLEKML